jgi:glucokinase
MRVAGIDLGGTKIGAGVLADGRLVSHVTVPTPRTGGEDLLCAMADIIRAAVREGGTAVSAVGLGVPSLIDYQRGAAKLTPNVAGLDGFPIRDRLRDAVGVPVVLENDANAAALAEHRLGAARGAASSFYLTVSTGIGGGFVIGDRVWHGAHAQAAEAGHLILFPDGPACGCGGQGCLEALASGWALEREAAVAYARPVEMPQLLDLWRRRDPIAVRIIAQAVGYVGIALASLAKMLDPEVMVIGGGIVLGGGEAYRRVLADSYKKQLIGWVVPPLRVAALGDESGIVGAALAAAAEIGVS